MSNPKPVHLNVDVDDANPKPAALEILRIIRPEWKEEGIQFNCLSGGYMNKLFRFYHINEDNSHDSVIIRVYGKSTELMVDHDEEKSNMLNIHAEGCGSELFATFNNGLAYEFIPGSCVTLENVRDPHIGRLVSKAFADLHHMDVTKFSQTCDLQSGMFFKLVKKFLQLIPRKYKNPDNQKRFEEQNRPKEALIDEFAMLESHLKNLGSPVCFCHNDLQVNNIVLSEEKDRVTFIDFEIGGLNHIAYDFACHFLEWTGVETLDRSLYPSKDTQCSWLRNYLEFSREIEGKDPKSVTDRDVEILYVQVQKFSLLVLFFCSIWGLVAAEYPPTEFDYMGYATLQLNEYFTKRDELLALSIPN